MILSASDTSNSYLWSTGANSSSISVNTSDNYILTSSNQNGCTNKDSVSVLVNSLPVVNAGNDLTIISGSSTIIGGNPTASSNSPFTYNWQPVTGLNSSTVANPIASPQASTTYSVTVIDSNGCMNADSVAINLVTCRYSLSDTSYQFESSGGPHSFKVTTNSNLCSWQVNNTNDWLHITPSTLQTGAVVF